MVVPLTSDRACGGGFAGLEFVFAEAVEFIRLFDGRLVAFALHRQRVDQLGGDGLTANDIRKTAAIAIDIDRAAADVLSAVLVNQFVIQDDGRTIVGKGELCKDGATWEGDLDLTYTRVE